jgi:2'-hydroxyisoflavone reductase
MGLRDYWFTGLVVGSLTRRSPQPGDSNMDTSRRDFVRACLAAGGTTALGLSPAALSAAPSIRRAAKPLRILILGGTGFIGPHQVRYAVARGHTVTLFNRGRTNPGLFADLEQLRGDRNSDLSALEGREWDAVVDNAAMIPRWVRDSAGLLKDAANQYLYISTLSVYQGYPEPGMDESAPVRTLDDPTTEEVTGRTYGGLKVLCEEEAERAFPGQTTVVRPGLIVGPGDPTDRWTYWPVRIARGGEVMAPGDPTTLVRFIDARDVSEWCIRMLEQGDVGVYNAVGPESHLSTAEMLYGIRGAVGNRISFTWVSAEFLAEHDVRPWSDMPAWLPPSPDTMGYGSISRAKAISKGLTFRPLAVTARETLDWWKRLPEERRADPRSGIEPEREAAVLEAWHTR